MAQRYARIDVDFMHKRTANKLLQEFGPAGPLVFLLLLLRSKDGVVPGIFTYTSEANAWEKLGLENATLDFTFDAFLKLTGRLKQTSRTPVGRLMNVKLTRYGDWQKDAQRYEEATKKSRIRRKSTGDTRGTPPGTGAGHSGGPSSSTTSIGQDRGQRNGKHPHDCPTCGARQPSRSALDDHLRIFHPADPEPEPVAATSSDDLPF